MILQLGSAVKSMATGLGSRMASTVKDSVASGAGYSGVMGASQRLSVVIQRKPASELSLLSRSLRPISSYVKGQADIVALRLFRDGLREIKLAETLEAVTTSISTEDFAKLILKLNPKNFSHRAIMRKASFFCQGQGSISKAELNHFMMQANLKLN